MSTSLSLYTLSLYIGWVIHKIESRTKIWSGRVALVCFFSFYFVNQSNCSLKYFENLPHTNNHQLHCNKIFATEFAFKNPISKVKSFVFLH